MRDSQSNDILRGLREDSAKLRRLTTAVGAVGIMTWHAMRSRYVSREPYNAQVVLTH